MSQLARKPSRMEVNQSAQSICIEVFESANDAGAEEYAEAAANVLAWLEANPFEMPAQHREWAMVSEAYEEVCCAMA
jgi:hypothetical protein